MTILNYPELMLVSEVCAVLRIHRATVVRWIREGKLRGFSLGIGKGGDHRIYRESVERYIDALNVIDPPDVDVEPEPTRTDTKYLYYQKYTHK